MAPSSEDMECLLRAREVVGLIRFYQEDKDHVLRRRFQRLHLYNLYNKHNRLVELDQEISHLEEAVMPLAYDGTLHKEAYQQAHELDSLLSQIDDALRQFGTFQLSPFAMGLILILQMPRRCHIVVL
jgi:hypothetical protein